MIRTARQIQSKQPSAQASKGEKSPLKTYTFIVPHLELGHIRMERKARTLSEAKALVKQGLGLGKNQKLPRCRVTVK